tara:strand:+ start:145 stop:927 length:783 start_codon:yes stop_codon:yes gene_type:complete
MSNDHGGDFDVSPTGDTESFPTDAELSRSLVASIGTGVLSTLNSDGYPYGSLISYANDQRGNPITLISELAEHTKNARSERKASLLVTNAHSAEGDPLTGARLTLVGNMQLLEQGDESSGAYLNRHPYAADYANFKDFNYWKLEVESCRFVGGFGHMSWMGAEAYSNAEQDPFCDNAEHAIEHMNDDHADANLIFVQELGGVPNASEAQMIAVDRYGMTFKASTALETRTSRVAFPEVAHEASQLEPFVIGLLRSLREDT